jgi:hypothetical protein
LEGDLFMKNKIYLFGIIALVSIIGSFMVGCDSDSGRETKRIIVTIFNENNIPISAVSILTISPKGNGGDWLVGTGMTNGVPVNITKNETYVSPRITVRRFDNDEWVLTVNVNNTKKDSYPGILGKTTPPNVLELKYTAEGIIMRR